MNNLFATAITSSIQENKDKIAKLIKQNLNLKNKNKKLKKQLEAYENMRKEAIEYIENYYIFDDENGEYYQTHDFDKSNAKKLHDILNKVGGSDETI